LPLPDHDGKLTVRLLQAARHEALHHFPNERDFNADGRVEDLTGGGAALIVQGEPGSDVDLVTQGRDLAADVEDKGGLVQERRVDLDEVEELQSKLEE
jgi:hypothetical protein